MDSKTKPQQLTEAQKTRKRELARAHYYANREHHLSVKKKYYTSHASEIKSYQAEYRLTHVEILKAKSAAYGKRYRAENQPKIKARREKYDALHKRERKAYADLHRKNRIAYMRKWRKNNTEKVRELLRNNHARRYKSDPSYRIVLNLRRRMSLALAKATKSDKSLNLIGTTPTKLRQHLESLFQPGMTWANYGTTGWHIDHIVPCAAFDLTDPKQQARCFHWSNLRPLWAMSNFRKGPRTDGQFQLPLTTVEAMEA